MTVCFIGHRKIQNKVSVANNLKEVLLNLIDSGAMRFLFGSKSEFNSICWEQVTDLKKQFPYIKRIYVRSSYPEINSSYEAYLLQHYEETYFPPKIRNAGKFSYLERNFEMIDKSDVCVFYYDINYTPPLKTQKSPIYVSKKTNSGTKIAYNYALLKNKHIINLYLECK